MQYNIFIEYKKYHYSYVDVEYLQSDRTHLKNLYQVLNTILLRVFVVKSYKKPYSYSFYIYIL